MCIPRLRYKSEKEKTPTCTAYNTKCSTPLSVNAEREKCYEHTPKGDLYVNADNTESINKSYEKQNLSSQWEQLSEAHSNEEPELEESEKEELEMILVKQDSLQNGEKLIPINKKDDQYEITANEQKIHSENLEEVSRLDKSESLQGKMPTDVHEERVEQAQLEEQPKQINVKVEQFKYTDIDSENDCISADIDATSVVPEEVMNYYRTNFREQSTWGREYASELTSAREEMSRSQGCMHYRSNCALKESSISTANQAEPINWMEHPSHVIVLSLLQYRGIFLPRHRTLVEYHMAELFLHYLDICRRGAYFIVYAENKWPREKFFRLRMLPRDWSSSNEMAVPQLVCTLHDTAIDVSNSTPLTMLVGLTQGVGEMNDSNNRSNINFDNKEHAYTEKSKHLDKKMEESIGNSTSSSRLSTTNVTKVKAANTYQSRHRVRPFLPFIIDKEFILGCRDGRGHRTRLMIKNAFTL